MAHKEMKAELTCPICIELFRQPRRLPCGHAYCHQCISTLLQVRAQQEWPVSRRLVCPECRDEMQVDYVLGIEALPIDFKLSRLVELVRSMESNSNDSDDTESTSPVREFPGSRPDMSPSTETSSSSPSTPAVPSSAVSPPEDSGSQVGPNLSSSSPPFLLPFLSGANDDELDFPELTALEESRTTSSVTDFEVPIPGLPRTAYDDYLDTLTYHGLWTEASNTLNSLIESFRRSPVVVPSSSGNESDTTDNHHHHSLSSASSSSLSSLNNRSNTQRRRRLHRYSWSSSTTSSDDENVNQRWSDPTTTSTDVDTVTTMTVNTTGAADNTIAPGPVSATANLLSLVGEGHDTVHATSVGNIEFDTQPFAPTTVQAISSSSPTNDEGPNSRVNYSENKVNNNEIDSLSDPRTNDNTTNRCELNRSIPMHSRQRKKKELEHSIALKEFLSLRDKMPQLESSRGNNEETNVRLGEAGLQGGDNNEAEIKKGKDNFKIKYLKLKKRVVNIFKDTYSTTESSDEEIKQERERQKERDRKKEREDRAKATLKEHQKKLNRETRKWRMTRNLIALILSDESNSDSDSNSNNDRRGDGRKQRETGNEDISRTTMERNIVGVGESGRRVTHQSSSDSDSDDNSGTRFGLFPFRRPRKKNPRSGRRERVVDSDNDNNHNDHENNHTADFQSRFVFESRINPSSSRLPERPSPGHHQTYRVPSIPPLLPVYDNMDTDTTNRSPILCRPTAASRNVDNDNANTTQDTPLTCSGVVTLVENSNATSQQRIISVPGPIVLSEFSQQERGDDVVTTSTPALTCPEPMRGRSLNSHNVNITPGLRLAASDTGGGGGIFYNTVCEEEIAPQQDRLPNGNLSTKRSRMQGNLTGVEEVRSDLAVLEINPPEECSTNGISEMPEAGNTESITKRHNQHYGVDCEMESLKTEKRCNANSSYSSETLEKTRDDSTSSEDSSHLSFGQNDLKSATEVKLSHKGARPKQRSTRQQRDIGVAKNIQSNSNSVLSADCLSHAPFSLYDNVSEAQTQIKGNSRKGFQGAEAAMCGGPLGGSGGEIQQGRKGEKKCRIDNTEKSTDSVNKETRHQEESGRRANLSSDAAPPCVNGNTVASAVTTGVTSATPPSSLSLGTATSAAATASSVVNVKENPVLENVSERNVACNKTSTGGEYDDGHLNINEVVDVHGKTANTKSEKNNNDDKMDNGNRDDDDSDIELAAPHSAMLKYSSSSGSIGSKKPKSRFRKFISSLMWVSSSSSSDDDYSADGDDDLKNNFWSG